MSMMASQILLFVDLTKTQKPKYVQNERFFLRIKKSLYTLFKDYFIAKNIFLAKASFNIKPWKPIT